MFQQFFSDLRTEFEGYNGKAFSADLMAGITVTAVALPLALAFGVSSGADAGAGLITAILAGLLISALSGASYQISGPTGAMAAILVTVVANYGIQGVFLATLMAGIILVIAGIFHVGRLVSIIPLAVISGFTSGIAIIIAMGQIDNFFGTSSEGGNALSKIFSYRELGFSPDLQTVAIGVFVMLVMILWPKKWQAVVPSSLASLILVLIVNHFLQWDVAVVGSIPRTLLPENRLSLSGIQLESIYGLLTPALSIAALGMIESLLCGAAAGNMKDEPLNADQELIAQGIGNIVIPFFGGVPATAAIARTSVAIKAGQRTRLTGIIHAVGLLLSMFLLSGIMSQIPMAALAGILMMTAWRMNEWKNIRFIFGCRLKWSILAFMLTLACTVIFDLSMAILAGVSFSCIAFVIKCSGALKVDISKVDRARLEAAHHHYDRSLHKDMRVAYVTGDLFFGNISVLINKLMAVEGDIDTMILSMRGVPSIDTSAASALHAFCEDAKKRDINILFAGVQESVKVSLKSRGIYQAIGRENFFWSAADALHVNDDKEPSSSSHAKA